MPRVARKPLHAGSWYEEQGEVLSKQIQSWLAAATSDSNSHARAVIGPHAGYNYCGHVMAYAYKQINPAEVKRVFLLGPSHHLYTSRCVLSSAAHYRTPLGDLEIDQDVYSTLKKTKRFDLMNLDVDQAEHSLELHLPFIKAMLGDQAATLVPIMVGALSAQSEVEYGRILAPFLDDPSNLFVISSDFCHWGTRFSYTYHNAAEGPIHKSVEWLDHEGMRIIEQKDPEAFTRYLQQYGNTICGRHPIGVFLNMLQHSPVPHSLKFTKYDQSSRCTTLRDSSVSYASAVCWIDIAAAAPGMANGTHS